MGTIFSTLVYARLHNFSMICKALAPDEATAFVNAVRNLFVDTFVKLGGEIAQRRPDSLLAVFTDDPGIKKPSHAQRGLEATIMAVHESVQIANRIAAASGRSDIPPIFMAAGVHLGETEISLRTNSRNGLVRATGEAVEVARMLELSAVDLRWGVAASGRVLMAAGGRVSAERIGSMGLLDGSFIDIAEISGLVHHRNSISPPEVYQALRDAMGQNTGKFREGIGSRLTSSGALGNTISHFSIEGYRILRKISGTDTTSIFLAQQQGEGRLTVLKILPLDDNLGADGLQRFMQEFALLTQVDHPNVARIFQQDFCAGHAYIAMEYFPLGDLSTHLGNGLAPAKAMSYVRQIAEGLGAAHSMGIVHRDLKPKNVMVRQNGTVALADFGIAKHMSTEITSTADGTIIGSPYYLSPEQALGKSVDLRSDLYSLGVMAYEMLTGRKPYVSQSMFELLQLHQRGPMPILPEQHIAFQPVLERLMTKDSSQRFSSSAELLGAMTRLGF
jgi:serine/threonine-protein kinase PpkA